MFKRLSYATVAMLLSLSFSANAQKVITFDAKPIKKKGSHRHRDIGSNSVTVGIGSFFNGYTALYYERKLNDIFTIAVGGGFTYHSYWNDLGALVWSDGQNSSNRFDHDIDEDYTSYRFRKVVPGYYACISPRFYFNDEALDGGYMGPMLELKQYNFEAKLADVNATVGSSYYGTSADDVPHGQGVFKENMTCFDLTYVVGGQYQARGHISLGWNVGIGVRYLKSTRLDMGLTYDGVNYHYANAATDFTSTRPLIVINFAIGGWF